MNTVFMSLECDSIYGIASYDDLNKIYEEYDISDDPAFSAEPIVSCDVLDHIDDDVEILSLVKLVKIMGHNMVEKRK